MPDDPFGEADFARFGQRMEQQTGLRLSQYKPDQMRRRIAALAQETGCRSFAALGDAIAHDPRRLAEFRDRMTINVTRLLRDPKLFEALADFVLPALLAQRQGAPLSVWSAGCSYGAEAYTLAMLLHEISPALPHRIWGSDIDPAALARAACPCFSLADAAPLSLARRTAHFDESGSGFQPRPHLRRLVRFGRHDLLTDPYPLAEYDLILCRNVVIYFTDEAKARVFFGFRQALRPGGVLFLGGTERLADHRAAGFELIRPFFYRKPWPNG